MTPCKCRCEVWSRVTGYLRPISSWNKGKQEEKNDRVPYQHQNTSEPHTHGPKPSNTVA